MDKQVNYLKLFIGIIIVIVLLIGICLGIMIGVDYNKIKNSNAPVFSILEDTYKDGGTKLYTGIGYKIIKYNKLNGYNKTHFGFWGLKYNEDL